MTAEVKVTNTGKLYSGKEVVQVYVSAPVGKLEKESRRLCGFAKTGLLAPGESETLTIRFPVYRMASYDESSAEWLLELEPTAYGSAIPWLTAGWKRCLCWKRRRYCPE